MLNNQQIKLVHVAKRGAGLSEGRYRFLLRQYIGRNGYPVQSCKQLTRQQLDDFLGICESLGFRHPGKPETFYRDKAAKAADADCISIAQEEGIRHLAGDLGMHEQALRTFIERVTRGRAQSLAGLSRRDAYNLIEALIAMVGRKDGQNYKTIADVKAAYNQEGHKG